MPAKDRPDGETCTCIVFGRPQSEERDRGWGGRDGGGPTGAGVPAATIDVLSNRHNICVFILRLPASSS